MLISVLIGFAMALALAIARLYGPRWASLAVGGYTTFFRGTPLLCQLYLVYYGLGQFRVFWQDIGLWWFFRDPFYCAALTFTLNTALSAWLLFSHSIAIYLWVRTPAVGLLATAAVVISVLGFKRCVRGVAVAPS